MPIQTMRRHLQPWLTLDPSTCSNLSLMADRLAVRIDEPRDKGAEQGSALAHRRSFSRHFDQGPYAYAYRTRIGNWRSVPGAHLIELTTETPFITGSGNASVHEAGMQLLRPWGVPYIPGSSIKGALSSWLSKRGGPAWARNHIKKSALQVELFGGVMDKEAWAGSAIFLDAWLQPDQRDWFADDITNTHHREYYAGNRFPDGTENPIPHTFSTLTAGLRFMLVLLAPPSYLTFLREALRDLLTHEGLGAKTSVGYGRFQLAFGKEEVADAVNACGTDWKQWEQMLVDHPDWSEREELADGFRKGLAEIALDLASDDAPHLRKLMKRVLPARLLLLALQSRQPATVEDARKIRDTETPQLKGGHVSKSDPDVQAVYRFCRTLPGEARGWLDAFEYSWKDVEISDSTVWPILESIEKGADWPPRNELGALLEKADLSQKAEVLEYYELLISG